MKKSFLGLLALLLLSTTSFQLRAASDSDDEGQGVSAEQRKYNQKVYEAHVSKGFELLADKEMWEKDKLLVPQIRTARDLVTKMNIIGAYQFKDDNRILAIQNESSALERNAQLHATKEADELAAKQRREREEAAREERLKQSEKKMTRIVLEGPAPSSPHVEAEVPSLVEDPTPEELVGEFFVFTPKPLENFLKLSKSSE